MSQISLDLIRVLNELGAMNIKKAGEGQAMKSFTIKVEYEGDRMPFFRKSGTLPLSDLATAITLITNIDQLEVAPELLPYLILSSKLFTSPELPEYIVACESPTELPLIAIAAGKDFVTKVGGRLIQAAEEHELDPPAPISPSSNVVPFTKPPTKH